MVVDAGLDDADDDELDAVAEADSADAPAAHGAQPMNIIEKTWLARVRDLLRSIDLQRCSRPGGLDTGCVCAQACALSMPAPPTLSERPVDWSDALRLEVAANGAITRCRARPTDGAAWEDHPCSRAAGAP
jgi:hypothetical protein